MSARAVRRQNGWWVSAKPRDDDTSRHGAGRLAGTDVCCLHRGVIAATIIATAAPGDAAGCRSCDDRGCDDPAVQAAHISPSATASTVAARVIVPGFRTNPPAVLASDRASRHQASAFACAYLSGGTALPC